MEYQQKEKNMNMEAQENSRPRYGAEMMIPKEAIGIPEDQEDQKRPLGFMIQSAIEQSGAELDKLFIEVLDMAIPFEGNGINDEVYRIRLSYFKNEEVEVDA